MTPSDEEKEAMRLRQDSIARVQRAQDSIVLLRLVEQQLQDSIKKAAQQETVASQTSDTIILGSVDRDKMGVFANSSVGDDELYILENVKLRLVISARGGKIIAVRLNEFQTYDSLPLDLFNPEETKFGLTFFASNRIINTDELFFQPVYSNSNQKLSMRLYTDATETSFNKDSYIEFLYSLREDEYMMDFDINFVGMTAYIDQGTNYLDLKWVTELQKLEKSTDRFNGPTIYYKYYQDDVDFLSEAKDDEEELTTRVQWISHKHRFFQFYIDCKGLFPKCKCKGIYR